MTIEALPVEGVFKGFLVGVRTAVLRPQFSMPLCAVTLPLVKMENSQP